MNEERDKDIVLEELEQFKRHRNFRYYRFIKVAEVIGVICKMRRGRKTRSGEIPMHFRKNTREAGMEWLIELYNVIFRTTKIPD